ncbi:MAG: AmmeMemoRadiSam system radical SAM enzyme [Firmicutes bacterium]|nr:AmmeMemoRadiSam system radical SAM enzyme [Bacillota bacterium]
MSKQAMYYTKFENGKVQCFLCPHNCVISPGRLGVCRARKNIDGELYSLNYGKVTSIALDPIEKKPLYRFHPNKLILSAGTFGCNLKCSFCQNWIIAHDISHDGPGTIEITPQQLVREAEKYIRHGNIGIAYTYNEPSIWYEFVYETSKLAKERGLANVLVTNGFISRRPLEDLLPFIDAMNIDVKAFNPSFYKEICKGSLDNVKETVEIAARECHVEITTLVIPGLNDSREEIEALAKWLASISPEITLHLSRYFPNYKMEDRAPTPLKTLENLRDGAMKYLKYVYLGNVR